MTWTIAGDNAVDAVTGERIFPAERVFDTGVLNVEYPFDFSKNRLVKEASIVWLAEQAGFTIVRGDERDSKDSTLVDGEDVGVGEGTSPIGESAVGGSEAVKRRSSRKTASK